MTDLDKAREWASGIEHLVGVIHPDAKAAIEIIQSLPNTWVDAEKLREVVSKYEGNTYISEIVQDFADLLPVPKLPSLADMTAEEREACQWMQCKIEGFDKNLFIISTGSRRSKAVGRDGYDVACINSDITPLPDLPKLQWPDGGGAPTISNKEKVAVDQQPNTSETPKSSIKPEDVPADELWLVECGESQWFAERIRDWSKDFTWRLTSMTRGSIIARDSEITLIHKLVPEPPALPEGMRLADHGKFGRVVTSPWGDGDDDYRIFFLNEDARGGADYDFAHESELTFLDGA